jgi:hypothetical protein
MVKHVFMYREKENTATSCNGIGVDVNNSALDVANIEE